MKVLGEMVCEECSEHFTSAASLLKHFAIHAIEAFTTIANSDLDEVRHEEKRNFIQRSIPDLHPISRHINKDFQSKLVNPLTVCEVTLNETKLQDTSLPSNINDNDKIRKYQCKYCKKRFGWSTDLKRHILIHTGERPFSCNICMSTFTRNFQLQKHISKCHKYKYDKKSKIPDLKPIYLVHKKTEKLRNSRKRNIALYRDKISSSSKGFEYTKSPLCTI